MNIAIIGAGNVGKSLGNGWISAGHNVTYGVSIDRAALAADREKPIAEAVSDAEVVVFAVPWSSLKAVVEAAGQLKGKVVVDCTNPIKADFSGLVDQDYSTAEQLADWCGTEKVVKAFNTVGNNIMSNPNFSGQPASMLIAADNAEAKSVVSALAIELGFAPVDAGPLSQSQLLEQFAWLWITMAVKFGHGRDMAFILNKR